MHLLENWQIDKLVAKLEHYIDDTPNRELRGGDLRNCVVDWCIQVEVAIRFELESRTRREIAAIRCEYEQDIDDRLNKRWTEFLEMMLNDAKENGLPESRDFA